MASVYFDRGQVPCGFMILPDEDHYGSDYHTVLIQTDWDFPGVAAAMGWRACKCGGTDGAVDCQRCGRTVGEMIGEALEWIEVHEGEEFEGLDDYFDNEG